MSAILMRRFNNVRESKHNVYTKGTTQGTESQARSRSTKAPLTDIPRRNISENYSIWRLPDTCIRASQILLLQLWKRKLRRWRVAWGLCAQLPGRQPLWSAWWTSWRKAIISISTASIYGGTTAPVAAVTLKRFGIECTLSIRNCPRKKSKKCSNRIRRPYLAKPSQTQPYQFWISKNGQRLRTKTTCRWLWTTRSWLHTFADRLSLEQISGPFHFEIHGWPCSADGRGHCRQR